MPVFLSRLLNRVRRRVSWALPIQLYVFVFLTSWPLMAMAEPGERIADPDVYWYWFVVTTTTVGYGDFSPTTPEGQAVSIYVILGGIVTITTVFARISQVIDDAKESRMEGRRALTVSGHTIVLGYTPGRTEGIVDALVAEKAREFAICAWDDQVAQHPMPRREDVHFVRGSLTDDDVLRRAALPDAEAILVDVRDDDEAIKVTVAVHFLNPEVHTVVALRDLAHSRTIKMVAPNAWCVQWHSPELIAEELHDAGMSQVYDELMGPSERNTFSVIVPASLPGRTFGEFQQALGRWNAATILAVRSGSGLALSPSWRDEVPAGSTLYYLGPRRLTAADLERFVDRSERAMTFSERELLRAEWHESS